MKKSRIWFLSTISSIVLLLSGCATITTDSSLNSISENSSEIYEVEKQEKISIPQLSEYEFNLSDIEPYSGQPYAVVNNNVPYFIESDLTTDSYAYYSDLDSLGRCGVAHASIGTDLMPTGERDVIGNIRPSGWHTVKYNDYIDGNYLFNRCHLIGYQLAGENANVKNLITGTRYLNVQGMLPFENMVADYVINTKNHVLYRVTPIFDGDNLVASGVLMEAKSVEDNGDDILFCVYVYNVQPNIVIDYATGDSCLDPDLQTSDIAAAAAPSTAPVQEPAVVSAPEQTTQQASEQAPQQTLEQTSQPTSVQDPQPTEDPVKETVVSPETERQGVDYILNTNTGKFHYPYCSSVDQMADKNKQEYSGSRDDVISMGYDPCKRCNP